MTLWNSSALLTRKPTNFQEIKTGTSENVKLFEQFSEK